MKPPSPYKPHIYYRRGKWHWIASNEYYYTNADVWCRTKNQRNFAGLTTKQLRMWNETIRKHVFY